MGTWWRAESLVDEGELERLVLAELEGAGCDAPAAELAPALCAIARARGAGPHTIQLWIDDQPKFEWSAAAYARWLTRWNLAVSQ
jgi:hypothetical protein